MHEHVFIENIVEQIPNRDKVISVEIELGDLVGIELEHLHEHMVEHTGWDVKIKIVKSKIKCDCGYIGEAKILQKLHDLVIFECPDCGNDEVNVLEGKDIKIGKVVYKE
jgi:Zn finger protein HypA/HybF involved in hydrogenase expression